MVARSAGLVLYRQGPGSDIEVLLGHLGGPLWARKHDHAWSIPKGLHDTGEDDALAVAEREFAEEMGSPAPGGPTVPLGSVKAGSKEITIFAREGDFDAENIVSNMFEMEWPPKSGRMQSFPEIDRAAWITLDDAERHLTKNQSAFVERLRAALRK